MCETLHHYIRFSNLAGISMGVRRWGRTGICPRRNGNKNPKQLLCLQSQIEKLPSGLFYNWALLRNNYMPTDLQRFTSSYGSRRFVIAHVSE